ncbi:MAG: cysteine peptidase family C39 domain-containing protein [Kofleriaceae bacterium]
MRLPVAFAVGLLALAAACGGYRGAARPMDPSRLTQEPGWIVAEGTPALRQRGAQDCGPAALAMVAQRWGTPLSVRQAAVDLEPGGARLLDLQRRAEELGLRAFVIEGDRGTLVHELERGRPVIVGLHLPIADDRAQRHYEVVVAVRGRDEALELVTIDPARGWRHRTWADLEREWLPAGHPTMVVLGPATSASAAAQLRAEPHTDPTHAPPRQASSSSHGSPSPTSGAQVGARAVPTSQRQ